MKMHKTNRYSEQNRLYELNIVEIDNPHSDCTEIALDSNIVFFGIISHVHDLSFCNKEASTGSFFVPFLEYNTVHDFIARVDAFVDLVYFKFLHKKSEFYAENLLENDAGTDLEKNIPEIKVIAYKFIDEATQKRHIAVGAVNNYAKDPSVVELNIKTARLRCKKPDAMHSWSILLDELSNKSTINGTTYVVVDEIMDFEERWFKVPDLNPKFSDFDGRINEALILLPSDSQFFASHITEIEKKSNSTRFINSNLPFSVYGLKKYRISSENEINVLVNKMIDTYRRISGMTGTITLVLKEEISNSVWDISIGTCAKPFREKQVDEQDEESF